MQFVFDQCSYRYPDGETEALRGVSLSIEEGEFVVVSGASGSGKSTFARMAGGLVPHFYGGTLSGRAEIFGTRLEQLTAPDLARRIGVVFQDPEKQIVLDNVERELVFGLENLACPLPEMRRRLAEVCGLLDLGELLDRSTSQLSSGELQKVVLGSVLITQPEVLILDEPTSQLSEAAAHQVLSLLQRLNRENGVTIVLVEQATDACLGFADRVLYFAEGALRIDAAPEDFVCKSKECFPDAVPMLEQALAGIDDAAPVFSVKQARRKLARHLRGRAEDSCSLEIVESKPESSRVILHAENVGFCYSEVSQNPALQEVSLQLHQGEITSILGPNGAGKSTLLQLLGGVKQPHLGRVLFDGEALESAPRNAVGLLTQDPNAYLVAETVEDELLFTLRSCGIDEPERVSTVLEQLGLREIRRRYPRDLSSGERQRVALASVLVMQPRVLLLDEPTRGVDAEAKRKLRSVLRHAARVSNTAVAVVSQDVSFAAECADRVVVMNKGAVAAEGPPQEILNDTLFFSTPINRAFRGFCDGVVRLGEARRFLSRCAHE